MNEIEVKILEVNPKEIRKKLKALGAKKFFAGEVNAVRYDFPDHRIQNRGEMLRLRTAGPRIELCYKTKNTSKTFKISEETEVITSDFEQTKKLLEKIGLVPISTSKKHRECYLLGDVKFDMDTIENIPTYLEVEAPSESQVEKYVKALGFTMQQTTNLSSNEVITYYERQTK